MFNNDDGESVDKIKKIFDSIHNINLLRTEDKFHPFDLKDGVNKFVVEVKKRNNNHDKYPTTMIGYNKYIKARQYITRGYNVYFVFDYMDGIYYYKYDNEIYVPKDGGRCDRGRNEIKKYIWININKLTKIENATSCSNEINEP
jgi:hypothetical protein